MDLTRNVNRTGKEHRELSHSTPLPPLNISSVAISSMGCTLLVTLIEWTRSLLCLHCFILKKYNSALKTEQNTLTLQQTWPKVILEDNTLSLSKEMQSLAAAFFITLRIIPFPCEHTCENKLRK